MSDLHAILACPRCDKTLNGLHCPACRVEYPLRAGVPWLFADPEAAMTEWRNRWDLATARLGEERQRAEAALEAAESPLTQARLRHLAAAYREQAACLAALLEPVALSGNANLESLLALRTRLPTEQGLTSYAANAFRDWVWGESENSTALDAILALLGQRAPERLLVLGAGAGRLAYDLHQTLHPSLTVALDNNPLFAYVAHRVTGGERCRLVEFPLAPRRAEHSAITRELKAPTPAAPGFHVVLADALRPPFGAASFDVVVTPWFIDVANEPPERLLPRLNTLLQPGGTWVNQGSLSFGSSDPAERLSLPELAERAAAAGFGDLDSSELEMPYLQCPESRHGRVESVLTFRADKVAEASRPPRHQALPDWLVNGRGPVPALAGFRQQAMATRIHAFIMSLIDGKRSIREMAEMLEEQRLMPRREAESAIRGFLIKMFEEATRGRGF